MIKKFIYISLIWMVFHGASLHAATLLVEAESFTEKGGWVVDQLTNIHNYIADYQCKI